MKTSLLSLVSLCHKISMMASSSTVVAVGYKDIYVLTDNAIVYLVVDDVVKMSFYIPGT